MNGYLLVTFCCWTTEYWWVGAVYLMPKYDGLFGLLWIGCYLFSIWSSLLEKEFGLGNSWSCCYLFYLLSCYYFSARALVIISNVRGLLRSLSIAFCMPSICFFRSSWSSLTYFSCEKVYRKSCLRLNPWSCGLPPSSPKTSFRNDSSSSFPAI